MISPMSGEMDHCEQETNTVATSTFAGGRTTDPAIFNVILSLLFFFKCNLPSKYDEYTTKIVSLCISKALVRV
jgi:hypothetical protein